MTTIFVLPDDLDGPEIEISGDVHHHLFRVGRMASGDEIRIADGAGRAFSGRIHEVGRSRAILRVGEPVSSNEPPREVQLLVAAPRKPRAEWLVEKATELGVASIRFLRTARGPRSYGHQAFVRFLRIAAAAAAQCERSRIPEVTGMHEESEIPSLIESSDALLVLDPSGEPRERAPVREPVSILVGPEGGWTAEELGTFAGLGGVRIGLGERILRVETAAIAALSRCVLSD